MNSNFVYNTTTGTKEIANTMFYAKDIANRPIFEEAQSIEPQLANTAGPTTIVELAANVAPLPYGYRYGGATMTFKNTLKAIKIAQRITDAVFETISNVTDLQFTFVYEPMPRLYTEHSLERGGNALGLDDTKEDLIRKSKSIHTLHADDECMLIFNPIRSITPGPKMDRP